MATNTEIRKRNYRDPLGRYYTKDSVSTLLISMMDSTKAFSILDLGCGQGSLSQAAGRRWEKATIISLDIETKHNIDDRIHVTGDALSYDLPQTLGRDLGTIDLAVCNPPYIKAQWRSEFAEVAKESGLANYISIKKTWPSELVFLVQMIRMLRPGGEAGIILPDGIFTAQKFHEFRKWLIKDHSVKKIIELPCNIFKNTEAKTHILIFNKGERNSTNAIELRQLLAEGTISNPIYIDIISAAKRMDYSYYKKEVKPVDNENLYKISDVADLIRGRHSSSQIKKMHYATIHTTDILGHSDSFDLPGDSSLLTLEKKGYKVAKPGDILVARVGRNLHKKIVKIRSGYGVVSDCLFIIRSAEDFQNKIYGQLSSATGCIEIENLAYGVAARQISKKQILGIYIKA